MIRPETVIRKWTRPARQRAAVLGFILLAGMAGFARAEEAVPEFSRQARERAEEKAWIPAPVPQLSRALLVAALDAARQFYLRQQQDDGLFAGEIDLQQHRKLAADDHARQAAGLWGLAILCSARPTPETQRAFVRGLNAFVQCTEPQPCAAFAPLAPGAAEIKTVTVAYLCLAIMEFASSQERALTPDGADLHRKLLGQYVDWLRKMEGGNGSWAVKYIPMANERDATSEPVCDSACLLVYSRAVRQFGLNELVPRLRESSEKLAGRYLVDAWNGKADPRPGLQFAPLGSQALLESSRGGGDDAAACGDLTLATAWWLLRNLDVAGRGDNLAANAQVLLAAYQVAADRKRPDVQERLRHGVEPLLLRALRLQANGESWKGNPWVRRFQLPDFCTGAFLSSDDGTRLRIDGLTAPLQAIVGALSLFFPEAVATPAETR